MTIHGDHGPGPRLADYFSTLPFFQGLVDGPEFSASEKTTERYVHEDTGLPLPVHMALVHHRFEAVHPFLDGNGRMGRLLVTLRLVERGLFPEPLLHPSAHFERPIAGRACYDHLLDVSREGAWEYRLVLLLGGVTAEANG